MQVLVINHFFDRVEAELISRLSKQGINFHCLTSASGPFQNIVKSGNIKIQDFNISSRLDFQATSTIRQLCKQLKPDLVHTFSARALSASTLALFGLKIPLVGYRGTVGKINRLDPTAWLSYLSPKVSAISCVSMAVENSLASLGIPKEKLFHIYKGHQTDWYESAERSSLSSFGIPSESTVVCCVANIRKNKGVDVLLKAAEVFLPEDPKAVLLLVGDLRDYTVARQLESHPFKDRIFHIGYHENASALVGASDIFVMPSTQNEGFPKAVIEAMCLSKPCIVSETGGLTEQVVHDHTGYIVPTYNQKALADSILKLCKRPSLRKAFGRAGQARVMSEFSIDRTVANTLDMYKKLLSK